LTRAEYRRRFDQVDPRHLRQKCREPCSPPKVRRYLGQIIRGKRQADAGRCGARQSRCIETNWRLEESPHC